MRADAVPARRRVHPAHVTCVIAGRLDDACVVAATAGGCGMMRCWKAWCVCVLVISNTAPAHATGTCTKVDVELLPAANDNLFAPQIVAWVEDTSGRYIETAFITAATGTYGIGNRPGRFDFNSGPGWPYGARITVFPIWSHRHGLSWERVVFQDGNDSNLSPALINESAESHFCNFLQSSGATQTTLTCVEQSRWTDKGRFDASSRSLYPPRQDITVTGPSDDDSVAQFDVLNPFDAVSAATPAVGAPHTFHWLTPESLPIGNYVLMVEVSRELDMNAAYNPTVFPSPLVSYGDFGVPYRGQPSVLYRVPFTIGADPTVATGGDYVGYGDPNGIDGDIRLPDATITVGVPGSGAERLAVLPASTPGARVRVSATPQDDLAPPASPGSLQATDVTGSRVTLAFIAPGDDGNVGQATRYEIRYLANAPLTADNFDAAVPVNARLTPSTSGAEQTFQIDGLLPETEYNIGIRAIDDCRNPGPLAIVSVQTADAPVDACFIATAAYGSIMANDVQLLRRFRDQMLRRTVLGELAVEGYYTFGAAVSGAIGESDLLRATARRALAPIVSRVRESTP
ncbi:MAG TPA: CFI-box-CTERM domain-containing protein [Kofleriaceae bacterium]|nr:CFI-box-CTERM domain-containing protein [Kofleriaceae bacterium]